MHLDMRNHRETGLRQTEGGTGATTVKRGLGVNTVRGDGGRGQTWLGHLQTSVSGESAETEGLEVTIGRVRTQPCKSNLHIAR